MSRTATILGKVSVTPKGAWNGANSYNFLDIVSNAGSSYLAVQPVAAGTPLDNTSYWLQIAAKGDPGQDGTDGAAGEITGASASISGGVGTPGVTVTPGGTPTARTFTFAFVNLKGEQGETGNGIASIVKTGTAGLVDTYMVTYTDGTTMTYEVKNGAEALDATLTLEGYAADAKATGDALALKQNAADPAGLADNLTPYSDDSGAMQDIPFIAQGTGCGNGESVVDTGSYLQFKKKLGNTVGVNQLVDWKTTADLGITPSIDASGVVTLSGTTTTVYANVTKTYLPIVGHKYLVTSRYIANPTNQTTMYWGFFDTQSSPTAPSCLIGTSQIITMQNVSGDRTGLAGFSSNTDLSGTKLQIYCIDLTLWFGSNDRIPSDLLSHPENWGRYYAGSLAYNAGTLESADGSILKSINRNCWDGEHDVIAIPNQAYYCKGTATITYKDRGGNTISTASVTNTSFTTPADCFSFGVSGTGVTISLYYSGESGYDEDYDFSVLAEVNTGSEVLRSAGAVADEKTPDGTITRRVGVVDLGTLTWEKQGSQFRCSLPSIKLIPNATVANIACAKYTAVSTTVITSSSPDKVIAARDVSIGGLRVYDTAYSSGDAAAFKTAMSGVMVYYELATPTTEQGTAFAENIPCDDFGSMYWTQTNGVPQGVEIFYPYDYKAAVDTILNEVNGDVTKLVTSEKVPDAPSSNGTYVLKVTVSGDTPTYSWVAE